MLSKDYNCGTTYWNECVKQSKYISSIHKQSNIQNYHKLLQNIKVMSHFSVWSLVFHLNACFQFHEFLVSWDLTPSFIKLLPVGSFIIEGKSLFLIMPHIQWKNNRKQIKKWSAIMDLYLNTQNQNVTVSLYICNGTALPQGNICILTIFHYFLSNNLHLTDRNYALLLYYCKSDLSRLKGTRKRCFLTIFVERNCWADLQKGFQMAPRELFDKLKHFY